jgi:hypothetical protein
VPVRGHLCAAARTRPAPRTMQSTASPVPCERDVLLDPEGVALLRFYAACMHLKAGSKLNGMSSRLYALRLLELWT